MKRRLSALGHVVFLAWGVLACGSAVQAQEPPALASSALQRLKDGNDRFATDQLAKKSLGSARRQELAKGQWPLAVVLACADSRVAPELIFDQGMGDLFVVRVAGNVTSPEILGSIEYALTELKVPLIVVLGHEECGAVKAALSEEHLSGNLAKLIARVHVGRELPQDKAKKLASAIQANVVHQVQELSGQSPIIKDFAQTNRVAIQGGIYSLGTGKVQWLERARDKEQDGR
jgi:carbonic anhydrase